MTTVLSPSVLSQTPPGAAHSAAQRQTAVSVYWKSELLLLFDFARIHQVIRFHAQIFPNVVNTFMLGIFGKNA